MPSRRRCFVAVHDADGELGWRPTRMPRADPTAGMGVAHDVLEHRARDRGELHEELRAIGVAYWLRGESGYLARERPREPPLARFASDLALVLDLGRERRLRLDPPPSTAPLSAAAEGALALAVRRAVARHRRRLAPGPAKGGERAAATRARMMGWLRVGYLEAARRYRGLPAPELARRCFGPVARAADRSLARARPGDRLEVVVEPERLRVRVAVIGTRRENR